MKISRRAAAHRRRRRLLCVREGIQSQARSQQVNITFAFESQNNSGRTIGKVSGWRILRLAPRHGQAQGANLRLRGRNQLSTIVSPFLVLSPWICRGSEESHWVAQSMQHFFCF